MRWHIALLVLLLLVPLAVPEYKALSSPIYPQLGYNSQHTGLSPWKGPQAGNLSWSVLVSQANYGLWGKAVDSNGVIYVGSSDGNFYSINPNGTIKWTITGILVSGSFPSVPAIGSDGTIYVGSSGSDYLYAINPNGTIKWKFPVQLYSDSIYIFPVVTLGPDGTIYVGGADKYLYAINPDGTLKWKYEAGSSGISAAVDPSTGAVYFTAHDYYVYAFSPDGSLKWKYLLSGTPSSPVVGPDGTVYVGDANGYVYAIKPGGTLKWKYGQVTYSYYGYTYAAVMQNPAIGPDGTIYVAADCGWLYALNPDGTLKWRFAVEGAPSNSGFAYGLGPVVGADGTVYIGDYINGYVYAINPDGTLKWRWEDPNGYPLANLVITNKEFLIAGDDAGYLYAFQASLPPPPPPPSIPPSPIYAQFGYDPRRTGLSPWKGPQTNNTRWNVTFSPSLWIGGEAADANMIYVKVALNLYAIDYSGNVKWKIEGVLGPHYCIFEYSTLQIGPDGTIYVPYFGESDGIYAVNPDGTIKWKFTPLRYNITGFSLMTIGPDGTIYVGITYQLDIGTKRSYFYALNPDGTVKWEYDLGTVLSTAVDPSTGVIYLTTYDALYALYPDGTLKWRYPLEPGTYLRYPVVGFDGTIYIESYGTSAEHYLYAINPDGTVKWRLKPPCEAKYLYPMALAIGPDGTIYAAPPCGWLYAINPNGTVKWGFKVDAPRPYDLISYATPAVGADGTIYVAFGKYLYAVNPDGTLKWKWEHPSSTSDVLIFGNLLITPPHSPTGLLIFGDNYGHLFAIGDPLPNPQPKPRLSFALAPDYSLWVLLLVAMCVAGFAFASRGKVVLGISFIVAAIAVYYVVLRPFVSLQTLMVQAQQLLSNAFAQIPLGPILPLIIAVAGIAVLVKALRR